MRSLSTTFEPSGNLYLPATEHAQSLARKQGNKLTIILLILFAICIFSLPAQAKYGGGSGTAEDPYLIDDANQMNAIGDDYNDWDKHFKLMADIDLSAYTGTSFNIIGYWVDWDSPDNKPFTGTFDGNGHTIWNLTWNSIGMDGIALFRYVGKGGQIKNLGLENVYIDSGNANYVGALVGYNEGGIIAGCYSTGSVMGNGIVGGLVGWNTNWGFDLYYEVGTITNCYSTGSVEGDSGVGGLVGGSNHGRISNCYSKGDVSGTTYVGGLMGYNYFGEVIDSFWDVNTSGQTTSAGGTGKTTAQMQTASTFAGWGCNPVWTIDDGKDYPRLLWEKKPGETITKPAYGGGSGESNDPYLIYTAEQLNMIGLVRCDWNKHFKLMADIDLSSYTGTAFNIIGTASNRFTGTFDGNGHTISNFSYTSTSISHIGLFGYVVGLIKDLGLIAPDVDAGIGDKIGSLVGRLGHSGTINNCYVEDSSVSGNDNIGGLVGLKENISTISNCYSRGSVSGTAYVGGVVGCNNWGNVSYCYFEGIVSGTGSYSGGVAGINRSYGKISNCYSSGSVYGNAQVGGLAGGNSNGLVSDGVITNCYSTSNVDGNKQVGGLVGLNKGVVSNNYSTGSVWGFESVGGLVGKNGYSALGYGEISNCYSAGSVTGATNVGGLVGLNDSGTVSNAFWDVNSSGEQDSDGGTGKTTAQMQTMSTFTDAGWDFVTPIWKMNCEGMSYPKLSWWQPVLGDFLCPDGVNFIDFSFFAGHWQEDNCGASNDCDGTDLDHLGTVNINDLRIFVDNWLAGL